MKVKLMMTVLQKNPTLPFSRCAMFAPGDCLAMGCLTHCGYRNRPASPKYPARSAAAGSVLAMMDSAIAAIMID